MITTDLWPNWKTGYGLVANNRFLIEHVGNATKFALIRAAKSVQSTTANLAMRRSCLPSVPGRPEPGLLVQQFSFDESCKYQRNIAVTFNMRSK